MTEIDPAPEAAPMNHKQRRNARRKQRRLEERQERGRELIANWPKQTGDALADEPGPMEIFE